MDIFLFFLALAALLVILLGSAVSATAVNNTTTNVTDSGVVIAVSSATAAVVAPVTGVTPTLVPAPLPHGLIGSSIQRTDLGLTSLNARVSTFAGSGAIGSADGTGTAASFSHPIGITTDRTNLFVANYYIV